MIEAMNNLDLNLLGALDALLSAGSVTGAARKLSLSSSAMSRTLTRLRTVTGDPLLVRAGRGLVPTPRAIEMRDVVHRLARDVRAVLAPQAGEIDIAQIDRIFTIRAGEGFVEMFSAPLVTAILASAPRARLRFAPKPDKNAEPLREGQIDLEIGVLGGFAPELRTRLIFRDRFVGAARAGHPVLANTVTPESYAACRHVAASRRGVFTGPVDDAFAELGLHRETVVVVPGFSDALRIARRSDLIALVPGSCFKSNDPGLDGISQFQLPVQTPEIAVLAMWHPRMDADPVHRWLRGTVIDVCHQVVAEG
ncbi:LysR substrate-binding domain-containing protein [Glacieibacterium megasporae]|uniref:LysR substrate-binding domain-containing protein n=1 Tax=Glacieibacterium megasporae TaxID=2835787 RepID=UPI0021049488|nr:LysR substrate-binding domain-containing protein [Polymorphobacter megasporae]